MAIDGFILRGRKEGYEVAAFGELSSELVIRMLLFCFTREKV